MLSPAIVLVAAAHAAPKTNFNNIIVAQTTGDAQLIWNAGDFIVKLKHDNVATDAALASVEQAAARILIERGAALSGARTVSVKIIYPHSAEFNPAYNDAVVSSMERLATLHADRLALSTHAAAWSSQLDRGQLPSDVSVSVTGKMPW